MKIPKDATLITIQGVEMQVIDKDEAVRLLDSFFMRSMMRQSRGQHQ